MNDLQKIYVADDTYGEFSVSHHATTSNEL